VQRIQQLSEFLAIVAVIGINF